MNIGQASKASGVTTKMIRYYDEIGLVRPSARTDSNYREYDEREINELRFIRRARSLGFSMPEITQLLSLWRDRVRPSREVKAIAERHLADLDARIAEAVKALGIRYVLISGPVVRGFKMPDGLVSLDESKSWAKIYDNGETRIYEWRGGVDQP